jgi:hypothetical protein
MPYEHLSHLSRKESLFSRESMFVFPESGIDYEQDSTRRHEVRLAFLPEEISRLDRRTLILIGDDLRQLAFLPRHSHDNAGDLDTERTDTAAGDVHL